MPRSPRIHAAEVVHHVIMRGNNKQDIFRERFDFLKFGQLLQDSTLTHPLALYNYALMTNHIHLLVETKKDGSLSKALRETTREYAKYFNKKYDHVGHVFQGRFKSFVIDKERYFFLCSRYIDLNPVKAGLVNEPEKYPWSGCQTLAFGRKSSISLDYHPLYEGLGNTPEERQLSYQSIVRQSLMPNLDWENKIR